MLKNIKVALGIVELVLSIGEIVTKAGKAIVGLFDKNDED